MKGCNDNSQELLADVLIEIASRVSGLNAHNDSLRLNNHSVVKELEQTKKQLRDEIDLRKSYSEKINALTTEVAYFKSQFQADTLLIRKLKDKLKKKR